MTPTERFRQWVEESPGLCMIGQIVILREAPLRDPEEPAPEPWAMPNVVKSDWVPYQKREVGEANISRPGPPPRQVAISHSAAIPNVPRDVGETVAAQFASSPALPKEITPRSPTHDAEAVFIDVFKKRLLGSIISQIHPPLIAEPANRDLLRTAVRTLVLGYMEEKSVWIAARVRDRLSDAIFDHLVAITAESLPGSKSPTAPTASADPVTSTGVEPAASAQPPTTDLIETLRRQWLPSVAMTIDPSMVFNPGHREVLMTTVKRIVLRRIVTEKICLSAEQGELLAELIFSDLIAACEGAKADLAGSGLAAMDPAGLFPGPFVPAQAEGIQAMPALQPHQPGSLYSMRHVKDLVDFIDENRLVPVHGAFAWRELVQRDEAGAQRPLKGAPNLKRGWLAAGLSFETLLQRIRHAYPGALGTWNEWVEERLAITPFEETAARQSGRYAGVGRVTEPRLKKLTAQVCGGCLRQRLWGHAPATVTHNASSIPVLCPEACNYFIAQAREALVEDEKQAPPPE